MSSTRGFFEAQPPEGYTIPPWPSLSFTTQYYLYYAFDIWFFIVIWSTLLCAVIYTLVSLWTVYVFRKNKFSFLVILLASTAGAVNGFVGGCLLGGIIGGLYPAASFQMSTWIAFVWGVLYMLITILGSYSTMSPLL